MLLGNYTPLSANPGRCITHAIPNPYKWRSSGNLFSIYTGDGALPRNASMPTGTEPPYSFHLAPEGGELSATTMIVGEGDLTASQQNGINIVSSIAGIGTIDTAGLSLVTSMISTIAGTGALTGSMVGTIQMAADLAGSGDISGSLGMLSGMVATLAGQGLISSDLKGKLFMEAQIYVNEGAATVDQIVDGVVDNLGSITATVPNLLDTETGSVIIPLD